MTRSVGRAEPLAADLIEDAAGRLHEAISLLDAIEEGSLLAELPRDAEAARRHQCAVSLLAILRRELDGVVEDLLSASGVEHVMTRVRAAGRTD
jgi:hypothetical protein